MEELLEKRNDMPFNNLDNYYQDFLKYSVFVDTFSFHQQQISLQTILQSLEQDQINSLKNEIKNIREEILYSSKIHGKYHSEKVLFWAYIIGLDNSLDEVDMRILLDAAKYHDIGRTNDMDDTIHGAVSASKILSYLDCEVYEIEENRNLLMAIVELHSLNDSLAETIAIKYHLEGNNRFSYLWKMLKDVDAIDRIRYDLGYLDELSFNPKYLRTKTAIFYIKASYELCTYYKLKYKI